MAAVHHDFPDPPEFEPDLVAWCRERGDYRPMLFEWYKHVGQVALLVASVDSLSPGLRQIRASHFAVLTGLLSRCSRLMLSNTRLSSTGRYGETTRLIDRCIAESAIKVVWLCDGLREERFLRFFADGLRNDIAFKDEILENIAARGGQRQQIEVRMLESIQHTIDSTGYAEQAVRASKRLPNMQSLMREVGFDDAVYGAIQRMGSHAVHGTWADLTACYLQPDADGRLVLRDHDVQTHHNQFVLISQLVIGAAQSLLSSLATEPESAAPMLDILASARKEIIALDRADWGEDFDLV